MVAYSFRPYFIAPIRARTKAQTIRAVRGEGSRHAHLGDALQLYSGMRTKHCLKIGDATASQVDLIHLGLGAEPFVQLGPVQLRRGDSLDDFARRDGFDDWSCLVAFWAAQHPGVTDFHGVIIRWVNFRAPPLLQGDGDLEAAG